jgi:hypothetical protein
MHPGVGIFNSEELPLNEDGKPDPLQMLVSIIDGQHHGVAHFSMMTLTLKSVGSYVFLPLIYLKLV